MKSTALLAPAIAMAALVLPALAQAQFNFEILDNSSNVVPGTLTINLATVVAGSYAAGQTIDIDGSVDTLDANAAYYGNFSMTIPSINGLPTDLGDPSFFTATNSGFGPSGTLTPNAAPQTILLGTFNVSSFYDYLVANGLATAYGAPTMTYQTSMDFSLDELDSGYNTITTIQLDDPALIVTGAVTLPQVTPPPPPPGVPEPGVVALLIAGSCSGVGFLRRRRH